MNYVLRIKAAVQGVFHRVFPTWMLWGLLLTVAACNADEGLPRQTGERAIGFATAGVDTRALPTTSVKKIGVFGYSHSGSFSTTAALTPLIPDYFLNKAVIDPTGAGNWSYTGVVKYWPDPDSGIALSFFAYAPYIDVEDTFTLYPSAINQTGSPTITYTVPADITSQIDLLWSNVFDQVYDDINNGTVSFTMEHALTRVDFSLKLNDAEQGRPYIVTINELSLRNLIGGGTLDLSKAKSDADLWSFTYPADDADLTTYTYVPGTGLASLTMDAADAATMDFATLFSGGHSLMLIPQNLKEDRHVGLTPPTVAIKYTCVNTYSGETLNDEVELELATALPQWEAGEGVNYLITLSLLEGAEIEFDIVGIISNTPWQDGNNGTSITGEVN